MNLFVLAAKYIKTLYPTSKARTNEPHVICTGAIVARGLMDVNGLVTHTGDAGQIAFTAGAGGTVTQATNSGTGVTLNKAVGQITTVSLTTAAGGKEVFTVTNSAVGANDIPVVSTTYAGAGLMAVSTKKVAAGSFDIMITNLHASAAFNAAAVINYRVLKGAIA